MNDKRKKLLKKIGIGLLILLAVFVILVNFCLGRIVKLGAESAVPRLTGGSVKMDSFRFNMFTGRATMKKFVIGNPQGYKTEYAFNLDNLVIDVDMTTLFSKKLVVEEIRVEGAHVIYELGMGTSNLGEIQSNISKATGGGKPAEAKKEEPAKKPKEGKKVQINDFYFNDAKVSLSAVALDGAKASVPMPNIHLKDIGKEEKGASIEDVANEMFNSVYKSAADVASSGTNAVKGIGEGAWEKAKGLFK